MLGNISKSKAQSTLEYAVLIGVIAAALIAMQVYVKRGFQGKLRDSADNMGSQFVPGNTVIYRHLKTNDAVSHENVFETGESKTTLITDQVQRRMSDSYENITLPLNDD